MVVNRRPDGWSTAKLAAVNHLLATVRAYQDIADVIAAAKDGSGEAAQLKADLLKLAKTQLAALKKTR